MEHNPFSLKGKTIFITGASSGIGRATALECSRMGAALIINGRNEERLRATFDSLEGNGHRMLPGDLSVPECMSAVSDSLPELDGVVYCAGITGHNLLPFIKEKDVKRMFDINYYAPATEHTQKSARTSSNSITASRKHFSPHRAPTRLKWPQYCAMSSRATK